jgi:hypothetical protein
MPRECMRRCKRAVLLTQEGVTKHQRFQDSRIDASQISHHFAVLERMTPASFVRNPRPARKIFFVISRTISRNHKTETLPNA